MSGKRRVFTHEFKLQVLREAENGISNAELCRRYELRPNIIYKWKEQLSKSPKNPFPGNGSRNTDKAKIAAMERLIGRQAMEIDFLKNVQRRLKETEK